MTKRMQLLTGLSTAAVMSAGLVAATPVQAAPVSPFQYEYRGDRLPSDTDTLDASTSPTWSAAGGAAAASSGSSFTATAGVADTGYLRMETAVSARPYWTQSGAAWGTDSTLDAFTVEFRLKVVSTTDGADNFMLEIGTTGRRVLFTADTTGVGLLTDGDVSIAGFDSTSYNVYRITGQKSAGTWTYNLYVNGDAQAAVTGNGLSGVLDAMRFGDISTNSAGSFDLDYIRWNNEAAVAPPIPEPASAVLATLGGVLLFARHRQRP